MNKKLSNKDLKDWKNFVEGNEKIQNKDYIIDEIKYKQEATIDLHGFSLDQANSKVEKFIVDCFNKKVLKLNIITGKGSRSKVNDDPYKSANFGILKYSIPEFIKNDADLIKMIKEIDFDSINSENRGSFNITLKKK